MSNTLTVTDQRNTTSADWRGDGHHFTQYINGHVRNHIPAGAGDIPMDALMKRVEDIKGAKADFACPRKRMRLVHEAEVIPAGKGQEPEERHRLVLNLGDDYQLPMNEHCAGQMYAYLGAGASSWFKTLASEGRYDLITDNVNQVMKERDGRSIIRTLTHDKAKNDYRARAFVSESFKPIDDEIVFGTAIPVIAGSGHQWRAIGGQKTDLKTYAKIVTREPVFSFHDGVRERQLFAGFIMSNSEVGNGFACFHAFLADGYCTNSAILGQIKIVEAKFPHRGAKIETVFGPIFEDRIKTTELLEITQVIQEAAQIAVSLDKYKEAVAFCELATKREMAPNANVADTLFNIGTRLKMTKDEMDKVMLRWDSAARPTQFNVQAAITAAAQDAATYEDRIRMERLGGDALCFTDTMWRSCQALN